MSDNTALRGGAFYISQVTTANIYHTLLEGNSTTDYGGAIYSTYTNALNIENSIIRSNDTRVQGGGIYFADTSYGGRTLTLTNTRVLNNTSDSAGGIYVGYSNVVIQSGSLIDGNSALNNGGGLYVANYSTAHVSATISDSAITNNSAYNWYAGGAYIQGSSASNVVNFSMVRSRVVGNTSNYGGGGLNMELVNAAITDSTISGNIATNPSGNGGIYYSDLNIATTSLNIVRTAITKNSVFSKGGGLYVGNLAGTTTSISNSTFSGNSAGSSGSGGGIYYTNGANSIGYSTLTKNTANNGGGVYVAVGTLSLTGVLLAQNSATSTNPDCYATFTTGGDNLIGKDTGGAPVVWGTGDQHGTGASPLDPLLVPRQ